MTNLANSFNILAFGAHPDDIELGCGGSLLKAARAGHSIRAVVFSQGRRGNLNDADREQETRTALGRIGVHDIHVYDFEDTQLWKNVTELIAVIERHVSETGAHRAYSMFSEDRHQDHRAVYEASSIACRAVPQFLGYETPSSYPNFRPTIFENIESELEDKIAALECHKSQGDRLYMQNAKVRAAAIFRGAQVSLGACEGFTPYKMII